MDWQRPMVRTIPRRVMTWSHLAVDWQSTEFPVPIGGASATLRPCVVEAYVRATAPARRESDKARMGGARGMSARVRTQDNRGSPEALATYRRPPHPKHTREDAFTEHPGGPLAHDSYRLPRLPALRLIVVVAHGCTPAAQPQGRAALAKTDRKNPARQTEHPLNPLSQPRLGPYAPRP